MTDSSSETLRIPLPVANAEQVEDPGFEAGQKLDKFELIKKLGQGGMGTVYLALDPVVDRHVAIKVLARSLADDEAAMKRFLAEARAVGQLNHPNVVALYGVEQHGGECYLIMEYVRGGAVADKLEAHARLDALQATEIVAQACSGLQAAHAIGLVHRDIKPANLMLDEAGTVKVADFGLARRQDKVSAGVTQAGYIVGTPYYMCPEQCMGQPVDARSDVYSLGATYYTLLTGHSPFERAGSAMEIIMAHLHEIVPDPKKVQPDLPPACSRIINRAMAKQPDDRYQSVEAMREDLNALAMMLLDKSSAKVMRYRGSVINEREMLVLPSEKQKGAAPSGSKSGARRAGPSGVMSPALSSLAAAPQQAAASSSELSSEKKADAEKLPQRSAAMPTPVAPVNPLRRKPDGFVLREEVYSLPRGHIEIHWAGELNAADWDDLEAWLDLVKRKLKRSMETGSSVIPPASASAEVKRPAH